MAYKLKTTGIAANCTMCIAVDPDTGTIKDFASSAVTAAMTVGAGITIGEQAWDGNTRKYFRLTTTDFVAFGASKPLFKFSSSGATRCSVVWIGEAAGTNSVVFGNDSSNYFAGVDLGAGGSTHPYAMIGSVGRNGGLSLGAGQKKIFGFSFVHTTTSASFFYSASDTATSGSVATKTVDNSATYYLSYVGRINSNPNTLADKIHAVLMFNTNISQADFDALRDDWFGLLLEQEAASSPTATIAATTASPIATDTAMVGITVTTMAITTAAGGIGAGAITAAMTGTAIGAATGTSIGSGAIIRPIAITAIAG